MLVLVSGATGTVGRGLTTLLLDRGVAVRALTRNPARAGLDERAEVMAGDLTTTESVTDALAGVDAAFLNVFGDDQAVVDVTSGLAESVRLVLMSSICASQDLDLAMANEIRSTDERLRAAAPQLTSLRACQFTTNTLGFWASMLASSRIAAPFVDVAIPIVDPADLAEVAVMALTGDDLRGQILELAGPPISPRQKVSVLSKVLDRPIELVEQTEDEAYKLLSRIGGADLADYYLAQNGRPGRDDEGGETLSRVLGRPPRSYADWAEQHRGELLVAARSSTEP